jgi:hypothetical protein
MAYIETALHSPHIARSSKKEEYKECTEDFSGKTTWEIFRMKRKMRYEN